MVKVIPWFSFKRISLNNSIIRSLDSINKHQQQIFIIVTFLFTGILYKKELRTLCEELDDIQALKNLVILTL